MAISDNEVWIGAFNDGSPCQYRKVGDAYIRVWAIEGDKVHIDVFAQEPQYTNFDNLLLCCTLD